MDLSHVSHMHNTKLASSDMYVLPYIALATAPVNSPKTLGKKDWELSIKSQVLLQVKIMAV